MNITEQILQKSVIFIGKKQIGKALMSYKLALVTESCIIFCPFLHPYYKNILLVEAKSIGLFIQYIFIEWPLYIWFKIRREQDR